MSHGALIDYPALAAIAAQFGDGALKTEAKRILSERDAERALADAIFDEFAKPTDEQDPIVRHDLKARYREAREQ